MSDEKRTILEMLAEGKITQEQADQLLDALGGAEETETEPEAEPGEPIVINSAENGQINLTLHPDHAEANAELPKGSMPPAPPAPPAPPTPPVPPHSPEDMERYIRECQENNERYCQAMNEYQQQMAQYAAQVEKLRNSAQLPPHPETHAPTTGSWTSWLSGIGEELRQGLREIGRELGRDLDGAMDDVSDAISDMKDALGEVVEDWQEELAEEQEELAEEMEEQMEEAAELAQENSFLNFGPNFPFGDNAPDNVEQVVSPDTKPEYENGQFIYRKWAGLTEIESLDINWAAGEVSVHPWDGDSIEVVESSKKALPPEQQCVMFVQDAKRLIIKEYPQQNGSRGIFSGWNNMGRPSKRLELLIPRDQCGQIEGLNVKCMSGTVRISELSGDKFTVSSVSGTVVLRSISADVLDAGTVSGTLTVEGCSAEKLTAHSVSGTNLCKGFSAEKAELTTVSGSLNAHGNAEKFKISTVSGSASLMVDQCPEKAHMNSVSGSLKIRLPENAGFTASYSSTSGIFRNDFGADIQADGKRKKSGRATFGSGDCKIDMHTTSGSMSVLKADGVSI